MIPQNFIQELLSRVDIVDLINKVSPLKKTGKNYMCCCPFHKEKTPSFSVSPSKQFYKCFGCGASGNAIGFVMQLESLNFPDAVEKLAESVGMTVPKDPQAQKKSARARTLTDYMAEAMHYYTDCLKNAPACVEYLRGRGISGQTAARFALGYSPDAWQALEDVFGEHYASPDLEETDGCGLVIRNEQGRRYDRFRGRLMFPIRNPRGQTIGFGARTLNGDEHPKYLNSPETALYHKGHEIYGLYEAQQTVRSKNRAIVCEGYMDVIQLSQAGFEEACACLGTAVTSEHVTKLLRLADRVYFSFDGDEAGQHALERAMHAAVAVVTDTQEVRFVVLPKEHDPDSLIKEQGAAAFEAEIEKSLTLSQFMVRVLTAGCDMATAEGRSRFLHDAKPLIVAMTRAPALRAQLINELALHARTTAEEAARFFGVAAPESRAMSAARDIVRNRPGFSRAGEGFERFRYGRFSDRVKSQAARTILPAEPAQDGKKMRLLQIFLNFPELVEEFSPRIEEEFVGSDEPIDRAIVEVWRAVLAQENGVQTSFLLTLLRLSEHWPLYSRLVAQELELQTSVEMAHSESVLAFDKMELDRVESEVAAALQTAQVDIARVRALNDRRLHLKASIAEEQARQIQAVAQA